MSTKSDSLKNIVGVALGVCLICSILVSTAAVTLKSKQDANRKLEKRRNILKAAGLLRENVDIETVFSEKIKPLIIILKTGERLRKDKMTGKLAPENYDIKKISSDSDYGQTIPSKQDWAGIKRMPTHMLLYFVKEENKISQIIFPVYGSGLWSIIYGFLSLDRDLKTIRGFTVYAHEETPGLGGEVNNPKWQASWIGKTAFDNAGQLIIKVLKGKSRPGSTDEIDGLSGATITTRGVNDFIKFWFSAKGYAPFLEKLKKEDMNE